MIDFFAIIESLDASLHINRFHESYMKDTRWQGTIKIVKGTDEIILKSTSTSYEEMILSLENKLADLRTVGVRDFLKAPVDIYKSIA